MVFAGDFLEGKADGEGLDVFGVCELGRGGLAGLGARLGAGDVLDAGERDHVAVFRRVEKVGRADLEGGARGEIFDGDGALCRQRRARQRGGGDDGE